MKLRILIWFRSVPLFTITQGDTGKKRNGTERNKADFLTFSNFSTVPSFRMLLDQLICIFISELTARFIVSSLTSLLLLRFRLRINEK